MSAHAETVRRRSHMSESQSPRTSIHSESARRRSRIIESQSPRNHYTGFVESEDDQEIEDIEELEELFEWEDFKIRALHFLEDIVPNLRIPFAIISTVIIAYWAIKTFSVAAGPAICDFPGAQSLGICQTNSSDLAVHVVDQSADFDFAPEYAEIQNMAAKLTDVTYTLKGQHMMFDEVIVDLTSHAQTSITIQPVHTATRLAVHAAHNALRIWLNRVGANLDNILVHYVHARNRLQEVKKAGPISVFNTLVKPGTDTQNYNTTLSELHEALSSIQENNLGHTTSALRAITAVEDSIELTLRVATGNVKVLKREKLGQERYWAWRLRSLKENYLKNTHLHQKAALLNWDARMIMCADFSVTVKRARTTVESAYLLMRDTQKTLDSLKAELGRKETPNIWAEGKEGEGNILDYYLRTVKDGLRDLERARREARELEKEAKETNWESLQGL